MSSASAERRGCRTTDDELELRGLHSFLHSLTISLSLRNTGTTTLSKNCTRTEKDTVSTCLCCTTELSTILSRNCWNLSLKITGTTTTRKRSLRELPPLPLFLLPPLPRGRRGGPVPGRMLGGRERLTGMDLGAKPRDRLLHLLPPLLLLQGLLRLNGVLEEELEGGGGRRLRLPRWPTTARPAAAPGQPRNRP